MISKKDWNQKQTPKCGFGNEDLMIRSDPYKSMKLMIEYITSLSLFIVFGLAQDFQNISNNQIPKLVDDTGSAIVMIIGDSGNNKKRQGSGVIVNNGDYVITNAHVVSGSGQVLIKFFDGTEQTVSGYSAKDEKRDLVSIKIKNNPNVRSVLMRQSDNINIGESVVAIGNPHGLSHSVSEGIVSGKREFEKGVLVLQTTAPVSPGSSGGGLFDMDGNLIGITSFLHKEGQNLNFAYPTEYIKPLLKHYDYESFRSLSSKNDIQSSAENIIVFVNDP